MNHRLIVPSIALLLLWISIARVSAGESLDERPIDANASIDEAFQSVVEQLQRDPLDKEARKQLIKLFKVSVEEVDESLEARLVTAALEVRNYQIGRNLSAEEAESLEERLEADPGDITARTHLIIYYHRAFLDEEARRARHNHVLWLIRNAPQAGVLAESDGEIDPHFDVDGYVAGRDAWLSHIEREPTNVTFLGHAANFLSEHQDRDLVIEYLQTLQSLDPDNPKWPTDLGRLYLRETIGAVPSMKSAWAMQALAQFRRAYDLSSWELERAHLLNSLGKAAFAAGHYDEARTYATEMLDYPKHDITFGDLLHHGPLILGMIALIENDIEQAKFHLLEAGRTPGSPVLGSFGPSMDLALQLLRRGERQVVLEYFELCSKLWPRDELNDWTAIVDAGGIPDFGSNLDY